MGCVQRGMVQAGRWARAWRTRAGGALSWAERNKEEQQPGARDVRRAVLVGRRAAGAGPLTVRRTAAAAPGPGGSGQSRRRGRGGANGRASARASKASRAGPLSSFFCLFVCFRPSPSRSSLAGSCPAAPWWRRRRRRTDPARPALPRPSHPVVSRAHCEQRRRREQTGSGRETAAGGDRPRARSRPRRVSGSAARAAAASSTIAAAAASSIETTAANPPAARARETASQRLEPTSARQPPANPCVGRAGARDARSPVLGSSSSS